MFKRIFGEGEKSPSIKSEIEKLDRQGVSEKELNALPIDKLVFKISNREIKIDDDAINGLSRSESDKNVLRTVHELLLLNNSFLREEANADELYKNRNQQKVVDTTIENGKLKRVPPSADRKAS